MDEIDFQLELVKNLIAVQDNYLFSAVLYCILFAVKSQLRTRTLK